METHLTTSELSPVDTVGRVDLVEAVPRFWGKRVTCGDEPWTCAVSEEGEARGRGAPPRCVGALGGPRPLFPPDPTRVQGASTLSLQTHDQCSSSG